MAAIDLSVINAVSIVIVFLLIFVGGWGVMRVVNPFKDAGKNLYGLIAFLLALLLIMSRKAITVIMTATPWLIVLALIAFFFIFFARMFGTKEEAIEKAFSKNVMGWAIFFIALIVVFSIGSSLGPGLLAAQPGTKAPTENVNATDGSTITDGTGTSGGVGSQTATSDFGTNLVFTLFHPKIIAVLFLFLLGTLTIMLLNK